LVRSFPPAGSWPSINDSKPVGGSSSARKPILTYRTLVIVTGSYPDGTDDEAACQGFRPRSLITIRGDIPRLRYTPMKRDFPFGEGDWYP
jgi:hypothetical protein